MTPPNNYICRFHQSLWLTLTIFVVLLVAFTLYVHAEKQINRANELQFQSHLLADELRQSAENLSHMARNYITTGNPIYKQYFQEILDIRDGKMPRPANYDSFYWDLLMSGRQPSSSPPEPPQALIEMMRQAGFSDPELAKLTEAKQHSDALIAIQLAAMQLAESSVGNRSQAGQMLQDAAYFNAKAAMMQPINQFFKMMETRTQDAVYTAKIAAIRLRIVFVTFCIVLILLQWRVYRQLITILGGSLEELYKQIVLLGKSEFSSAIPIPKGMENSVMAWLLETQTNLAALEGAHQEAEAKNLKLSKLYAALYQCNQSIVHCSDENELFQQICYNAVTFGDMDMAWIGLLDRKTGQIKPIASYGEGSSYLDGIHIVIDADQPAGRGPTGTAIREDRPVWCQDFRHDRNTLPWHRRAQQFNWQASGSLPLHQGNEVFGCLTLYSCQPNAFDEASCNLLMEMAANIDYALKIFERDSERQRALQMEYFRTFMLERLSSGQALKQILNDIADKLEFILPGSLCSILLLDEDGQHLRVAAAPSLPTFYNTAIDGVEIGPGIGSCGNAAYTGHRTIVENIAGHPYWSNWKSLAEKAGLAACWSEPILITGQQVLGTFAIYYRSTGAPDSFQIQLLEMASHFVALAITRQRDEEHIHLLANFDPLTGLPNRIQLDDHLRYAINLAKSSSENLALMFLDVDHFKNINDTLGHSIGDLLLIELSRRLQQSLRIEDTITRLGGDEFILLLPGVDVSSATYVAQKLLDTITEPYHIEQYDLSITASIGIALFPEDGIDLETLSKNADTAMYRAKQEGRRCYRFFTAEMQDRSRRNLQLLNELRHGLEKAQFQIYYQPQVSADDGGIIGAEALLRWRHPLLGMVSPSEFIPIAEDSGLILQIGEWVLRTAIRQAKLWQDQGFAALTMAVNLSAVQFRHPDLSTLISNILRQEGWPPSQLELELTESMAMHNPQQAIAVLNTLHDQGIRISIDDFGTGYSSLSYLKKFKVDKLKIDQSFVQDICNDAEDKAIITAVIRMAQGLGLQTIAEGVETVEQLTFLREQGCRQIQGYLISKPIPAYQFSDLLENPTVQFEKVSSQELCD